MTHIVIRISDGVVRSISLIGERPPNLEAVVIEDDMPRNGDQEITFHPVQRITVLPPEVKKAALDLNVDLGTHEES